MQDRALQLFNAAVAPNEHAGGQVVPVWRSLAVYAVTDTALAVRGLPMENAVAMQDLFPAKSSRHRKVSAGGRICFLNMLCGGVTSLSSC